MRKPAATYPTWKPDTCGCWFEREPDGSGLRLRQVLFKCEHHASIRFGEDVYAAAKDENARKNVVCNRIAQWTGVQPAWAFDAQRVLVVPPTADEALNEAVNALEGVRVG